jgi:hypothetical protein
VEKADISSCLDKLAAEVCNFYKKRIAFREKEWGWSFMYSRTSTIWTSDVAFISLNPKADESKDSMPDESQFFLEEINEKAGDAYHGVPWAGEYSGLQTQVQRLFEYLSLQTGEVMCAQCVPFKSPTWATLPDRLESIRFSRDQLWTPLVRLGFSPKLVILNGVSEMTAMSKILAGPSANVVDVKTGLTGWGDTNWYEETVIRRDTGKPLKLIAIPHLSRFKLLSKSNAAEFRSGSEALGSRLKRLVEEVRG